MRYGTLIRIALACCIFVGCADSDLSETVPTDSTSSPTPVEALEPEPDPPAPSKAVVARRLDTATERYDAAFVEYLRLYNANPERLDAAGRRLVNIEHTFKRWVEVAGKAIELRVLRVETTTFSEYVTAFRRWLHNQGVENQLFFDCFSAANLTGEPPPGLADCVSMNPPLFRLGIKYATVLYEFQRRYPELTDMIPDVASIQRPSWMVL